MNLLIWCPFQNGGTWRAHRKRQRKHGSGARLALHCDITAHEPRELPAYGQSKSASLRGAGETARELHERLENLFELVACDAVPIVFDVNCDQMLDYLSSNSHLATAWTELDRIRQKIDQYLVEAVMVSDHGNILVSNVLAELRLL